MTAHHDLGFFGNIWVSQHIFEKAGEITDWHEHNFDHVGFLTHGKVEVEVPGYAPKEFTAPTFIMIRKHKQHKVTALEDGTLWYCVMALRNMDGEVMEIVGDNHDPIAPFCD